MKNRNGNKRKINAALKWLLGVGLLVLAIELTAIVVPYIREKQDSVKQKNDVGMEDNQQVSEVTKEASWEKVTPTGEPADEVKITPEANANDGNANEAADKADVQQASADKGQKAKTASDASVAEAIPADSNRAQQILEQMDLYEKVCQMFIVFPESLTGVSGVTAAGDTTKNALAEYPVGGILYMQGNLKNEQQVTKMIRGTQSFSKLPLFIACDEEGGRVARVMKSLHTYSLNAMLTYKDAGTDRAFKNAGIIANAIGQFGFNTDFAPVADVLSNPDNTVIGDRAYSDDYAQAAKLVKAAVKGFHEKGMICSLKHFPGHGDTSTDTHNGSAYVTKTLDELRKEEFLPFKAGIDAGADMVMVGHLIVRKEEDLPATISHRMVTDILRNELGFNGVVITDALNMKAMTDYYGSGYIATKAVKAGVDILLCPASLKQSVTAIMNAVKSGEITKERIDTSVLRIIRLKLKYGIIK